MIVGYARVSTKEQSLDRQIKLLVEFGIDERNIYKEKATGFKANREKLNKMIDELKEGDIVVITDLTRISRSTKELLILVDKIKAKNASIKSIKDIWLDTTSSNPYNEFLLTVMAGMSQLERDLISSRTKEGLEAAKERGRLGGRPSKQNEMSDIVMMLYNQNYKIVDIVRKTGLSRSTVYRIINK